MTKETTQNRRSRRATKTQVAAAEQTHELIEATAEVVADGALTIEEATDTIIDAGAVIIDNDTQQVVSQPDELADAIAAELAADAEALTAEPEQTEQDRLDIELGEQPTDDTVPAETSGSESPTDDQTDDSGDPSSEAPTEAPTAEEAPAPAPDPFADLPMTKIEDYEFADLSSVTGSDPRKYEAIHKSASEQKLPMKPNWKHANHMFTKGVVKKEHRPGSVYATIEQVVNQYGRAGVPSYVLVTQVRQRQIGNKRSHYCTSLPPIGWAEGWIDTYISKSYGKVMEKKAPPLTVEQVEKINEQEAVAEAKAA